MFQINYIELLMAILVNTNTQDSYNSAQIIFKPPKEYYYFYYYYDFNLYYIITDGTNSGIVKRRGIERGYIAWWRHRAEPSTPSFEKPITYVLGMYFLSSNK